MDYEDIHVDSVKKGQVPVQHFSFVRRPSRSLIGQVEDLNDAAHRWSILEGKSLKIKPNIDITTEGRISRGTDSLLPVD